MKKNVDSLGDRMKRYEGVSKNTLINRLPVIIRLDGKAFHTFTKGMQRPYDEEFSNAMSATMLALCEGIQGAVFAYKQSDEISILLQDWATFTTDGWYDYNVQKIVSVSASIATATFNDVYKHPKKKSLAFFDSRAFNIPFEEVNNYFLWRQNDATRNSINSLAQANFSHRELQGLKVNQVQDKLFLEKSINWNDCPIPFKRGVTVVTDRKIDEDGQETFSFRIDNECPVFSQEREYVNHHLSVRGSR